MVLEVLALLILVCLAAGIYLIVVEVRGVTVVLEGHVMRSYAECISEAQRSHNLWTQYFRGNQEGLGETVLRLERILQHVTQLLDDTQQGQSLLHEDLKQIKETLLQGNTCLSNLERRAMNAGLTGSEAGRLLMLTLQEYCPFGTMDTWQQWHCRRQVLELQAIWSRSCRCYGVIPTWELWELVSIGWVNGASL